MLKLNMKLRDQIEGECMRIGAFFLNIGLLVFVAYLISRSEFSISTPEEVLALFLMISAPAFSLLALVGAGRAKGEVGLVASWLERKRLEERAKIIRLRSEISQD